MNINVHIERLILDGISIPHRERPLLQATVEAELARLLASNGLAPDLQTRGMVSHIPGDNIQLKSDGNPGVLGEQIAQAVYRGIGRNTR